MPRYIIHIGPYKTGSSYLQTCLAQNAAAMRKSGIDFTDLWTESPLKPSHTGLVQRLNTERRCELQPIFDSWRDASKDETIVISCEGLAGMSLEPTKVQMLRELTAGSPVTIVYYVRRWSELLASEWQEYVKQGSTVQLLEVLAHNLRDSYRSRIINVDVCLRVYAEIFGKHSIKIISYDSIADQGMNIFNHFSTSFLMGESLFVDRDTVINASFLPAQAELARIFNCLGQETGVSSQGVLRYLQLEHPPAPVIAMLRHISEFIAHIDVDDDDPAVRDILTKNREDYAACALAPVEEMRFYRSKNVQIAFVRPEYGLAPGFAETVRILWKTLLDLGNNSARAVKSDAFRSCTSGQAADDEAVAMGK